MQFYFLGYFHSHHQIEIDIKITLSESNTHSHTLICRFREKANLISFTTLPLPLQRNINTGNFAASFLVSHLPLASCLTTGHFQLVPRVHWQKKRGGKKKREKIDRLLWRVSSNSSVFNGSGQQSLPLSHSRSLSISLSLSSALMAS